VTFPHKASSSGTHRRRRRSAASLRATSSLQWLDSSLKSFNARTATVRYIALAQVDSKTQLGMTLGPVSLIVRNLEDVLDFYVKGLGLKIGADSGDHVELLSSKESHEPLLILRSNAKAEMAPADAAGLYHYALLLPDRRSLAAAYLSVGKAGVLFDGHADHLVSEALYLTDPEGNGIEIYADRPRDQWKFDEDGQVQMGTQPLDVDSLVQEVSGTSEESLTAIPEATRVGHIHLKVTNLERSVAFYHQLLGLDLMSYWGNAAFLSVSGYHHHIGMNTWESLSGSARRTDWSGLEFFTMKMAETRAGELSARLADSPYVYSVESDRLFLSDPDGIELVIRTV
jgi:catechol 2,3-dioxygenase